jgi:damage-control phosphatase, subfamily I
MKTYLDCYPCFLRQALEAARIDGASEPEQRTVLDQVMRMLETIDLAATPPEIAYRVQGVVSAALQVGDPYRTIKAESTRRALDLYEHLKSLIVAAADPLEVGVRLAIVGNLIDYGPPGAPADAAALRAAVDAALQRPLAVNHLERFRSRLTAAEQVFYLADNAGETIFDRVLIETLAKPTTYVVKGAPVLNDATFEDALAAGLDGVARVLDNGSDAPGTILAQCSAAVRAEFGAAEIVVAKGQANYETLSDCGREVFFLLQVKCPVIARDLGVPVGSMVIK